MLLGGGCDIRCSLCGKLGGGSRQTQDAWPCLLLPPSNLLLEMSSTVSFLARWFWSLGIFVHLIISASNHSLYIFASSYCIVVSISYETKVFSLLSCFLLKCINTVWISYWFWSENDQTKITEVAVTLLKSPIWKWKVCIHLIWSCQRKVTLSQLKIPRKTPKNKQNNKLA